MLLVCAMVNSRRKCRSLAIRGLYANLGAGVLVTSCIHPFSTQYGRKRMSLPRPACTDVELAGKFAEAHSDRWRISLVCMRRHRCGSLRRRFVVYVNMEMATKGLLRDGLEGHAEHHGDPRGHLEFRKTYRRRRPQLQFELTTGALSLYFSTSSTDSKGRSAKDMWGFLF